MRRLRARDAINGGSTRAGGSDAVLCCIIGMAALSPVGAWLIARRRAALGAACCVQDGRRSTAVLVASVGAAGVAGYLLMASSPATFQPICKAIMSAPAGWPRF